MKYSTSSIPYVLLLLIIIIGTPLLDLTMNQRQTIVITVEPGRITVPDHQEVKMHAAVSEIKNMQP